MQESRRALLAMYYVVFQVIINGKACSVVRTRWAISTQVVHNIVL